MTTINRRSFLARASCALAAPAILHRRRPNILFFFPDQHRFDWTGLNPDLDVRTPHLASLARRGVAFQRAIVASPLCAPSRACLASGKEYHRARVPNNGYDYPLDQPTFYAMLREAGYHVAGCGKFDLHKKTEDWGLDGKRLLKEWGFSDGIDNAGKFDAIRSGAEKPRDPYMAMLHARGLAALHVKDYLRRRGVEGYAVTDPTPLPEDAYADNWIAENGLKLLRAVPAGKPWFLQVNFNGPHNPMDITARMEKTVRGRQFPQPNRCTRFDPKTHVAIRQNYTAMVENIDRWLGIYLEELRKRGELENTLIVYSSDHGEMLGDHDLWGKSVPYRPSIGVPLVLAGPGVSPQPPSQALVSHMDLTATFLEAAGLRVPRDMDSRSLWPLLTGKARSHREFVLSGLNRWRAVWDGRYKLVTGFGPGAGKQGEGSGALLFDTETDPLENVNLAAERADLVERLRQLIPEPPRHE
jgi:arylsulfatase A-like enzyme